MKELLEFTKKNQEVIETYKTRVELLQQSLNKLIDLDETNSLVHKQLIDIEGLNLELEHIKLVISKFKNINDVNVLTNSLNKFENILNSREGYVTKCKQCVVGMFLATKPPLEKSIHILQNINIEKNELWKIDRDNMQELHFLFPNDQKLMLYRKAIELAKLQENTSHSEVNQQLESNNIDTKKIQHTIISNTYFVRENIKAVKQRCIDINQKELEFQPLAKKNEELISQLKKLQEKVHKSGVFQETIKLLSKRIEQTLTIGGRRKLEVPEHCDMLEEYEKINSKLKEDNEKIAEVISLIESQIELNLQLEQLKQELALIQKPEIEREFLNDSEMQVLIKEFDKKQKLLQEMDIHKKIFTKDIGECDICQRSKLPIDINGFTRDTVILVDNDLHYFDFKTKQIEQIKKPEINSNHFAKYNKLIESLKTCPKNDKTIWPAMLSDLKNINSLRGRTSSIVSNSEQLIKFGKTIQEDMNKLSNDLTTKKEAISERIKQIEIAKSKFNQEKEINEQLRKTLEKLEEFFKNNQWEPLDKEDIPKTTYSKDEDLSAYYLKNCESLTDENSRLNKKIDSYSRQKKFIAQHKQMQEKARMDLTGFYESNKTTEQRFESIRNNHKKYLEKTMITRIERKSTSNDVKESLEQAKWIKEEYYSKKAVQNYLSEAIKPGSMFNKIKGGALALLLGGVAGYTAYSAGKSSSVFGYVNPLAPAKNAIAGGLAGLLGVGVMAITYKIWAAQEENANKTLEQFNEIMDKNDFENEKYIKLSENLVKLMHFRETLLLKEEIDGIDVKNKQLTQEAIETFFLAEMNELFNEAFKEIYEVQEQEISKDKEKSKFRKYLEGIFQDTNKRKIFTQELQIHFMQASITLMTEQMKEPGIFAKYPLVTATITGLIAGAIGLSIAAAVLGGPIALAGSSIALVSICLAAVATAVAAYLITTRVESVKFKRSASNREGLRDAIVSVGEEKNRLGKLIEDVPETTEEHRKKLEFFKANKEEKSFYNLFGLLNTKNVALGSNRAWCREHALRYRHSLFIENDVGSQYKDIIDKSNMQTKELQEILINLIASNQPDKNLNQFIEDTKKYIETMNNEGEANFYKVFEIKNKIKEQILEIVSVVPINSPRPLPQNLINLYTETLGGQEQDLKNVRKISPIATPSILKTSGKNLDKLISKNLLIFNGEHSYRSKLGMTVPMSEQNINNNNIDVYLKNSKDFLLSLLRKEKKPSYEEASYPNEYLLYSTLMLRQMAALCDPNNKEIENEFRNKIFAFAEKKLRINNPKIVFNHLINHDLLNEDGREEQHISQAIMMQLANHLQVMSPKKLIEQELGYSEGDTFCTVKEEILVNTNHLTFNGNVNTLIKNSANFIKNIEDKPCLLDSGAIDIYLDTSIKKVEEIIQNNKDNQKVNLSSLKDFLTELRLKVLIRAVENVPNESLNDMFEKQKRSPERDELLRFLKDIVSNKTTEKTPEITNLLLNKIVEEHLKLIGKTNLNSLAKPSSLLNELN